MTKVKWEEDGRAITGCLERGVGEGEERGGLWKGGLAEHRCCGEIGEGREKAMPTATPHEHTQKGQALMRPRMGKEAGRWGGREEMAILTSAQ